MTAFTYQDAPAGTAFEVKASAQAADGTGTLYVTTAGVVNIAAPTFSGTETHGGAVVFTSTETHTGAVSFGTGAFRVSSTETHDGTETHNGAVTFQTGVLAISGPTTVGVTLSFSGAIVCAMAAPVTVTTAPGGATGTLIFSRRLRIQDAGGNVVYLYGGVSAQ